MKELDPGRLVTKGVMSLRIAVHVQRINRPGGERTGKGNKKREEKKRIGEQKSRKKRESRAAKKKEGKGRKKARKGRGEKGNKKRKRGD